MAAVSAGRYEHVGPGRAGRRHVATGPAQSPQDGRVPERPDRVIAELTFGFWRYLFARRYQASLWRVLAGAFPNYGGRPSNCADVERDVEQLPVLRKPRRPP